MAVIKTLDLIGTSDDSWEDAAAAAAGEATRTLRGVEGLEVANKSATMRSDGSLEWRAHVRIRFRIEPR